MPVLPQRWRSKTMRPHDIIRLRGAQVQVRAVRGRERRWRRE
jgi:hypothetical protein